MSNNITYDGALIGVVARATAQTVFDVLSQPEHDDGRSEWTWLVLPNGDLMLGVWPRGETYERISDAVARDFNGS